MPTLREEAAFRQWKKRVDEEIEKKVGLTADDLPDVDYWGWFQDGVTPKSAANQAVRNARN